LEIYQLDRDLYMNGPEIFNFINSMYQVLQENLVKNNKNIDEIDHFVFHQANAYMLKSI
jgi:3-oxoacyl-[acyl-carrier-protein] synthase-3